MKAMPQLHALVGRPAVLAAAIAVAILATTVARAEPQRADPADPLIGTWDTAPIPITKLQATLAAHGYTTPSINKLFHNQAVLNHIKKSIKYEIQFYRETDGTPFQIVRFWDPTTGPKPPDSKFDHGPYKLLPGTRLQYTGVDPPTDTFRTTFRYAIHGNQLTLQFVSLVEPGLSATQRLADQKRPIMQAAAPYKRVAP